MSPALLSTGLLARTAREDSSHQNSCSPAAAALRRESSTERLLQAAVSCWVSRDYASLSHALLFAARSHAPQHAEQLASAHCPDNTRSLHSLGDDRCSCSLVDIGLNDGGTLLQWPKSAAAKLSRGDGRLSKSLLECVGSARTCYTGFEMQARYTARLREQELAHRRKGGRIQLFTETAFAISADPVEAFVDPLGGGVGTSLVGDTRRTYRFQDERGRYHKFKSDDPLGSNTTLASLPVSVQQRVARTVVAAVDAGAFLCEVAAQSDFVALKLDVEAFEFTLLPHLILNHPAELARLSLLAAEWHEYSLVGARRQQVPVGAEKALAWLLKGPLFNITVLDWV